MSSTKTKDFVPNVAPKMDPKEQARLQAQIGNLRKQYAQFVVEEQGQQRVLNPAGERPERPDEDIQDAKHDSEGKQSTEDGGVGLDLKSVPTLYMNKCKDGKYSVEHRTTKILIENVHNTTISISGKILTSTVEVWKCTNVTLNFSQHVKTLQLDMNSNLTVNFERKEHMQAVVWQDVEGLQLRFGDHPASDLDTGFAHMVELHPDSQQKLDQFIVRFLDNEEGETVITPERCVRLKNGFLSTEREAVDWDRRNELAKDKFMSNFLKESGLTLNKQAGKKVQPNTPCTCGSGKKFKKCCQNKKEVTALAPGQKVVY